MKRLTGTQDYREVWLYKAPNTSRSALAESCGSLGSRVWRLIADPAATVPRMDATPWMHQEYWTSVGVIRGSVPVSSPNFFLVRKLLFNYTHVTRNELPQNVFQSPVLSKEGDVQERCFTACPFASLMGEEALRIKEISASFPVCELFFRFLCSLKRLPQELCKCNG